MNVSRGCIFAAVLSMRGRSFGSTTFCPGFGATSPGIEGLRRIACFQFLVAFLQPRIDEIGRDVGDFGVLVMFGVDDADAELARQRDEGRGLEAVIADLDHVAQPVTVECLRQQFEEPAEVLLIEFLVRRELPEQGSKPRPQLGHAGLEKSFDRVAGLRQHAPVYGVARSLHRKHETVRHFGSPLAKCRRCLGAIEGAVDLDRGEVHAGVGKLARMRQALRVEHAPPRLVSPASDTGVNPPCRVCHAAVMSVV